VTGARIGKWVWVALAVVVGLPAFLLAVAAIGLVWERWSRYDKGHPDYVYASGFMEGETSDPFEPARINGGDWQFICFLGPYSDPARAIRAEAARRGVALRRVDDVFPPTFGVASVEESESAISFVDRAGHGHTMLIDGRLKLPCGDRCFARGTKVVTLPASCN